MPRKKYPEPTTDQNLIKTYMQSINTTQKPKNVVIFTDSMFKSLRVKEFNKNLDRGIAHLKPFLRSKTKQMDYLPYQAIHVGINDLLKSPKDNVNEIPKDVMNIALSCRSHNIATTFIFSIVYSTKVSHTIIQKLNGLLRNECTKYNFHLLDRGAVSK